MIQKEKRRSFFERLTGGVKLTDEDEGLPALEKREAAHFDGGPNDPWAGDIIVQTFVAGVSPSDLEINITRDMITIRGKRAENAKVQAGDFFSQELYWGSFSRTVSLPQEIEPDEAEAIERHGLLTIRMPKIDKNKKSNLKVKSV